MEQVFEKNWPKVNIHVTAYIHQLLNYRYHWHEDEYELDIVLSGMAEFVRGDEHFTLESGDLILINPGVGHASFSLVENTAAMVIRISREAFNRFLPFGKTYRFDDLTDSTFRKTVYCRKIRYYSTLLLQSISLQDAIADARARASLEMLTVEIAENVPSEIIAYQKEDLFHQQAMRVITSYMEEHYQEKVSLEDLAKLTQYNRTYISTIFRQTVGIRFYDYLTRIRITNALYELGDPTRTLTQIALDNGFPDLKNFNLKFRETIHVTPAQYRSVIQSRGQDFMVRARRFYSADDKLVHPVLERYADVF